MLNRLTVKFGKDDYDDVYPVIHQNSGAVSSEAGWGTLSGHEANWNFAPVVHNRDFFTRHTWLKQ